jgi:ribosome maturation factor RimP
MINRPLPVGGGSAAGGPNRENHPDFEVGARTAHFFYGAMTKVEERVTTRVAELAEPVLAEQGLELVEVQYRRESGGWMLRLFIDRPPAPGQPPGSGVTLDDCVLVNRELGYILDVEDVAPGEYTLEVSSPGLDRPLTKKTDYDRFVGRLVRVKAVGPEGKRTVTGRLLGLEDETIRVDVEGRIDEVPLAEAKRVKLVPEVDWGRA